ncbi:MAG: phosphatidylserine decarboxylase [Alphaproteobacteria bacterium]|nr:phosphatidylserine decarboxylase [Alphaproteobacteria bacterium]
MELKNILLSFHPEGWPFMAGAGVVMILLSLLGWPFFTLGAVVFAWCCYFFRDPARVTPTRPGLIVSPADGKVVAIKEATPDGDLDLGPEPRVRISIFLNIFDVHVNRMPADGTVTTRRYRKGKFFNASLDKASVSNERMALNLKLTGDHPQAGKLIGVVQIAGLIARRIVCDAKEGSTFSAGERYGIIRFGSRVDIYLPPGVQPMVALGQYMLGGETVLADCHSNEAARQGAKRE